MKLLIAGRCDMEEIWFDDRNTGMEIDLDYRYDKHLIQIKTLNPNVNRRVIERRLTGRMYTPFWKRPSGEMILWRW